MLITSVYLNLIPAFDASESIKLTFEYSGSQCIANRLIVYDTASNSEVYNQRVASFSLSHTIPADTLVNGGSYYAKITAYYIKDVDELFETSVASNTFWCLSKPTWYFSDIIDGQTIRNSSIDISMIYEQAQNESVDEFTVIAYTQSHSVFYQTDTLYSLDTPITISGLEDNQTYFLRAIGRTVNGLSFDTRSDYPNDITVIVDYILPNIYSLVSLENVPDLGYIKVSTNIASIEGVSESGETVLYIDGEYADLKNDRVKFTDNIFFSDEYTVILTGRKFSANEPILDLYNQNSHVKVFVRSVFADGETKYFAELRSYGLADYVLYTSPITISNSDELRFAVQYKDGCFDLSLAVANS